MDELAIAGPTLLDPLFFGEAAPKIFSDVARLQGMLDFEAALARAEASVGVIPAAAVDPIISRCDAAQYDVGELALGTATAGNPAIPLVKALTAKVKDRDPEAARYVHWGATSQDVIDTGMVLQLRQLTALLEQDLARLSEALGKLADVHRDTPMVGRTWLQHALPVTFGLKVAAWLDAVERHRTRLREIRPRLLVLQFGGAAGTLAALGDKGLSVTAALADELHLAAPLLPWHTTRDRLVEFGCILGLIVGSLGKIAGDIALLMQTDVAEAFEPSGVGRGGSSTMPHKRNPVTGAVVLAAAIRAPQLVATLLSGMNQQHERGLGGWHAEWIVLPELAQLTSGALAQIVDTITGLDIDPARMRSNLDATNGLILAEAVMMALGAKMGRLAAHDRVEECCRRAVTEKRHLRDVIGADNEIMKHLGAAELDRLFDPVNYVGAAPEMIDRVLAARRK